MEVYVYWFVLAFILLVAEMSTGTFYFLALSAAAALGGVAAQMGMGVTAQFSLAGAAAVAGTLSLRYLRKGRTAMPDAGLDIGQPVKVLAWHEDGSARVHYRGTEWDAGPESPDTPHDTTLYISSIEGSKLILTQHKTK